MTMSYSINETRNSLQKYNKCNDKMELLTSRITKNSNHKFWKCRGCKNFQSVEDRKSSEEKIDLLVKEVRKLTLEIKCLFVEFYLFIKNLSICNNIECRDDCLTMNFKRDRRHDMISLEYLWCCTMLYIQVLFLSCFNL